jgi:large subunit ribosomal protein L35
LIEQGDLKMPKIKTNRGAAKRFKTTGSGKVVRSKAYANHHLGKKSPNRKRNLRKSGLVHSTDKKNVTRLIPYL